MEPLLCTTGSFCPKGSSTPTPCSSGTFGSAPGLASAAQCTPCPEGSWCSAGIEIPCERGYHAAALPPEQRTTQATCVQCPADSTTADQGSAAITQCICSKGFFTRQTDGLVHGEGDCVVCPPGTACDTIGLKIQDLPVKAGWWRASNTSVDVQRCDDHDDRDGSGCVGGPTAMACKDNLDGPFCVLCKHGPGHYYNNDVNDCLECDGGTKYGTIIALLCLGLGCFFASGALLHYCSLPVAKACKPTRRRLLVLWVAFRSLMVKVKIAWSFYQVRHSFGGSNPGGCFCADAAPNLLLTVLGPRIGATGRDAHSRCLSSSNARTGQRRARVLSPRD